MSSSRYWRVGISAGIALCAFLISLLAGVMTEEANYKVKTYFDNVPTTVLERYTSGTYYNGWFQFKEALEKDAISIITSNVDYNVKIAEVEGMDIVEDSVAYSPIVMIFPHNYSDSKHLKNFSEIQLNSNRSYYMTDAKAIIEEVVNSEDHSINLYKLGFTDKEDKKAVLKLGIPDNGCTYRRDVINSIIYILSDGKPITTENRAEIAAKLKVILDNATNIKNPVDMLQNVEGCILMMPEYLIKLQSPKNTTPIIYWENCYAINFRLITRVGSIGEVTGEEKETRISQIHQSGFTENEYKSIVDKLTTQSKFWSEGKVRNNYKADSVNYYYVADTLNVVYAQPHLEELLGESYWKSSANISTSSTDITEVDSELSTNNTYKGGTLNKIEKKDENPNTGDEPIIDIEDTTLEER